MSIRLSPKSKSNRKRMAKRNVFYNKKTDKWEKRPVKAIEGRKSGRAGEGKGPMKAIEGRKAKRPHEEMPESRKRSKAARLYGDWLKD